MKEVNVSDVLERLNYTAPNSPRQIEHAGAAVKHLIRTQYVMDPIVGLRFYEDGDLEQVIVDGEPIAELVLSTDWQSPPAWVRMLRANDFDICLVASLPFWSGLSLFTRC
jgi:hypothetical protein